MPDGWAVSRSQEPKCAIAIVNTDAASRNQRHINKCHCEVENLNLVASVEHTHVSVFLLFLHCDRASYAAQYTVQSQIHRPIDIHSAMALSLRTTEH